jgi:hypothetical protein
LTFIYRFSHVWFFDATSESSLVLGFKKFGKAAGVGQTIEDVWDFLQAQKDWLLIFDNADNPKLALADYICHCDHGSIIITSRLPVMHQMASEDCGIDIQDLHEKEAITLLLKRARKEEHETDQLHAGQIVDALGCHALAVDTAGAFLNSNATHELSGYLYRFNKYHDSLNFRTVSLDGYNKTVLSAFMLSFDQLTEPTKLLMQICSCLHHVSIPLELFKCAASFEGNDLCEWESIPDIEPQIIQLNDFLNKFPEESSWDDSVDELCRNSLATYSSTLKALSFHPIYHTCALQTISEQTSCAVVVKLLLGRVITWKEDATGYQFRQELVMHAVHGEHQSITENIRTGIAKVLTDAGIWKKSEELWNESLEVCTEILGVHHPNTLASMNNLALVYSSRGKLEEAEALQEGHVRNTVSQ